jgi:hypothetical protein
MGCEDAMKWYGRLPPIEGGGVGRSCPPRRSPLVKEGPSASGAVDNWTLGIRQVEGEGGTLTGLQHQRAQSRNKLFTGKQEGPT